MPRPFCRYSLCVITTYVKKSPPELEAAMAVIKGLKGIIAAAIIYHMYYLLYRIDEVGGAVGVAMDDALKYLSLLVDVKKLYDVALGMYDFELVLQVAKRSQKVNNRLHKRPIRIELYNAPINYVPHSSHTGMGGDKRRIDLHICLLPPPLVQ